MMKTTVDCILYPRWIIPVEPQGQVYQDYAVVIEQGLISALVPQAQARQDYVAGEEIELPTHVVMPGFVNTHTHAPMSLLRGLADDLPLMTWLNEHIWPAERAHVSVDFIRDGGQLACAEMLQAGITCFNDMYFFPEVMAEVVKTTGMRAGIGLPIINVPTPWSRDCHECIDKGLSAYHAYQHEPRLSFMLAPHAPYTVDNEILLRIKNLSQQEGLRIHMHVHETQSEVEDYIKQHQRRPLAQLHSLGLLDEQFIAVHMTQVNAEDLALLKTSGIHIVTCPHSNLKLASGMCPIATLLENNVNVAIGTDGAASNNDLDMLSEMQTSALLAKGLSGQPTAVSAQMAVQMATLNGARAMGLSEHIGSLVAGKQADIIAVNMDYAHTQPLYHPISTLVYAARSNQVSDVWVAGNRLLAEGQLTTLDLQAVLAHAREWRDKLEYLA